MDSATAQEYCHGYYDDNVIWNNGFYCPKWTGTALTSFCCGTASDRYCCPLPATEESSATSTTLIVGLSIVLSFLVFTFIACFFCQGCPLNKFYIRKRLSDDIRCPACRHRGHVPMVLSNENGLIATCASRDCRPMLLGPSDNGFVRPYPLLDRCGWSPAHSHPVTEVNVIYPRDDPPPYQDLDSDKDSSSDEPRLTRCLSPTVCVDGQRHTNARPLTSRTSITGTGSALASLSERRRHPRVEVFHETWSRTGRPKAAIEHTLERTTVV